MHFAFIRNTLLLVLLAGSASLSAQIPPRMRIYHFDVNVGDSTLIISPDGRGVLIDFGTFTGGVNNRPPVKEFLDQAKADGILTSLDFTIASHYDADHIRWLDFLYENGWYPEVQAYDRGNSLLPSFDVNKNCGSNINMVQAEQQFPWDTAEHCDKTASCQTIEYLLAAEAGGKRQTITPGTKIELDHGIEIVALVVNAQDIDGLTKEVYFPGRRDDCAANDLSIGLLVKFGDFRYLTAGDLTGDATERVANIEEMIQDDAENVDVYHVNHHGSRTSSSIGFIEAISPTVAIASAGNRFGHPTKVVVDQRLSQADPPPVFYTTNKNSDTRAWNADDSKIADLDMEGFEGIIELQVFRRSYRVFLWKDGEPQKPGDRYFIKHRD